MQLLNQGFFLGLLKISARSAVECGGLGRRFHLMALGKHTKSKDFCIYLFMPDLT